MIFLNCIFRTSPQLFVVEFWVNSKFEMKELLNVILFIIFNRLDPKANENVLDMCASPGNKTTHLAQLMNDSGRIVALDKSKNRVSILKQNVQRLKLECVESYHFDATKAYSETADNSWTPPFSEGMFDKILCMNIFMMYFFPSILRIHFFFINDFVFSNKKLKIQ